MKEKVKCKKCGLLIDDDMQYCPYCGYVQDQNENQNENQKNARKMDVYRGRAGRTAGKPRHLPRVYREQGAGRGRNRG